ncbi:MAG: hypothetical protein MR400_03285 [Clostridiales bacterium]|nr:hypothetical protein [Clostridiales bacterium]
MKRGIAFRFLFMRLSARRFLFHGKIGENGLTGRRLSIILIAKYKKGGCGHEEE